MKNGKLFAIAPIFSLFKIILGKQSLRFAVTLNLFDPPKDLIDALSFNSASTSSVTFLNDCVGFSRSNQQFSLSVNRREGLDDFVFICCSMKKTKWLTEHRFSMQVNNLSKNVLNFI